jgi:aryl-alcohol dehydrogenase-like predicted oxidoreductase
MQTTKLGSTSVEISAIGLGAMPLSLDGRPSEEKSIAVIHHALDLGVTLIDTADAYCLDESDKHHNERLIHKALASYLGDTSQVIVATKGGLMRPKGDWTNNGDPQHLRQTIRESFAALGGEKPIDLWQYHAPDPDFTIEASMTVAKEAVEEGLIKHVGVSNFSIEQIERARSVVDIVSVQNAYHPWHREPESDGVLQYCEDEKLTFLPWSPLGGWYRFKKIKDIPELVQLAQDLFTSPENLILAWLRHKSPCVVPIPGASKTTSIQASVQSLNLELDEKSISQMDRITSNLT